MAEQERVRRGYAPPSPSSPRAGRQRVSNRAPAVAVRRAERPRVEPTKKQLDYRARYERWQAGDQTAFSVSTAVDKARREGAMAPPSGGLPDSARGRKLGRALDRGLKGTASGGTVGARYVFGAKLGSGTYDCSSLVKTIYGWAGINLPRVSRDQFRVGKAVKKNQLRRGDLLFWSGTWRAGISHVAIYLGNGKMLEAPGRGKRVRIVPARINTRNYAGARRVV